MSFHTKGATYPRRVLDLMFQNKHITEEQYQNMMEYCNPNDEETNLIEIPKEFIEQREKDITELLDNRNSFNKGYIWETFDSLFKTVHKQGQKLEEMEKRLQICEDRIGRYLKPNFPNEGK